MKNPFDNLPGSDDEDNNKFTTVSSQNKSIFYLIQTILRKRLLFNPKHKLKREIPDLILMTILSLIKEKTLKITRVTGNKSQSRKSLITEPTTERVEQEECKFYTIQLRTKKRWRWKRRNWKHEGRAQPR